MTPDERRQHKKWQAAHRPTSKAERATARQRRNQDREARQLLEKLRAGVTGQRGQLSVAKDDQAAGNEPKDASGQLRALGGVFE